MYVKVIDGERRRAAIIYEADGSHPLDFGRARLSEDPSELDFDEMMVALGAGCDSMDRTQVGAGPFGYTDEDPYWEVGWVRFRKPALDGVHLVAATTPIYLMDDSGQTVERV